MSETQAEAMSAMSAPARAWFARAFTAPTEAQLGAWTAIASGDSALVVAPTGSGKTLAAFFSALDRLTSEPTPTIRSERCRVLYISPLKALAVDVERNLRSPLVGITGERLRAGLAPPDVTVGVRTGDTPAEERRRQARNPPDILITTPESLFLLLTSAAREALRSVDTVIVDEVHAVAGSKRGAHLAVSLERLDEILAVPARRIGLSATVRPTSEVARFLGGAYPVRTVSAPADKRIDVRVEVPVADMTAPGEQLADSSDLVAGTSADPVAKSSIWPHVEERVVDLIESHTSTLVFANSRRLAERLTSRLNEIAAARAASRSRPTEESSESSPPTMIARAHHGSVSKEQRALIEEELKSGQLPAVVATSSLELGIDMGAVDLVIQVEAPPSVASGLQRIGRAGHQVGAVSHGTIFPKFRGDLVQTAVVATMMQDRRIEALSVIENPLDVLAQQVIAMVAMDDWDTSQLYRLLRRSAPFTDLPEAVFEAVLDMIAGKYPSDEFAELRPRVVWDRDGGTLSARPGAQRLAVTSGGTIPDRGLFGVFLAGGSSSRVGELDEEMVYESRIGDVFALGASSWRIEDITHDRVLVSPAPGRTGRVPFWHGDALGRSAELGRELGAFIRTTAAQPHEQVRPDLLSVGLDDQAADNLLDYLTEQVSATGRLPDDRTIVVERCRDELGDWQVIIHSPHGARVHAPWAMAIANRLEHSQGQDVSVFHSDDGIVLRLPDTDDDEVWSAITEAILIDPDDIAALVTTVVGGSALFSSRFRECAARALLLPKRDPQRRAPLWQQRQRSSQLLSVAARYPTFPIVLETVRECLHDVFDLPALTTVLRDLDSGAMRLHECETQHPSPFATSLLFGYVAAYLYEGDSPLAERRAQALTLDAGLLAELLGEVELRDLLDADALATVAAEVAWLTPERRLRGPEDLADALRVLGPLTMAEIVERGGSPAWSTSLLTTKRAIELKAPSLCLAAIEDAGRLRDALGCALPVGIPWAFTEPVVDPLGDLLARYARTHGPFNAEEVAQRFGIGTAVAIRALSDLVAAGRLVAGQFRPGGSGDEWCDAHVLRRIRRRSVAVLREQAEPVPPEVYASFLPAWQGIGGSGSGIDELLRVITQLAGMPLVASTLETLVLPSRVADYSPAMLDELTTAGEVVWAGAGGLPRGDGWLALAPSELRTILPEPLPYPGSQAAQVLEVLAGGGGWFLQDLTNRLSVAGLSAPESGDWDSLMVDLMWSGHVTNDSLTPIRRAITQGLRARRPASRGPARPGRNRTPRRQLAQLPGRWSLVNRGDSDPTRRAKALVSALLTRHAVVTRSAMSGERFQGGFASAYRILAAMEDTGAAIRTYAIEGLGAAQFTTPSTVDRLRALARADRAPSAVLLAATDPAQPYGAALPWPSRIDQGPGHRPGRKAGSIVVMVAGELVVYLERGGKSMLTWARDVDHFQIAVAALADAIRVGRVPPATLTRIDGVEAAKSLRVDDLTAAGFRLTPKGLRMRAGDR